VVLIRTDKPLRDLRVTFKRAGRTRASRRHTNRIGIEVLVRTSSLTRLPPSRHPWSVFSPRSSLSPPMSKRGSGRCISPTTRRQGIGKEGASRFLPDQLGIPSGGLRCVGFRGAWLG